MLQGTHSDTNNDTNGTMLNDKRNDGTISGTIRNDTEQSEDIENLILDEMRADKRISVKQLSKLFGKSKTSMFRIIEKLKADGKIRRLGSEKSGTWDVIE